MTRPKQKRGFDYGLLVVVLILVIVGLIILYSTSAYNGQVKFHDSFYYLKKQAFATSLGLAIMYAAANIDYHVWQRLTLPAYLIAIALSVAVLLVGDEYNGSKRWLSFGPLSFQPSEFAKIAVILFLANIIVKNEKKNEENKNITIYHDSAAANCRFGRRKQS